MPLVSELADTYLTACAVEGKSPNTIRDYRQSLERLQKVTHERGLAALRERMHSRAYHRRLHREVLRTRAGRRNHALMLFVLDTGVRASECVSVHLDDVDWDHGRVRVLGGRGQKQRWVGLARRHRPSRGAVPLDALGSRDDATRAQHDPQTDREEVGVEQVHPHRFRHTFATWAVRSHAR